MNYRAYLIIICDQHTDKILDVVIWSSPEWEQSRHIDRYTYVAYAMEGGTFAGARDSMLSLISNPKNRYHHLYRRIKPSNTPLISIPVDVFDEVLEGAKDFYQYSRDIELADAIKKAVEERHKAP